MKKTMKMGSTKKLNISTLVFIVIEIFVENSNANVVECLNQIKNVGKMDKYFNGKTAFEYAYNYLADHVTVDSEFLRHYLLYLYKNATLIDIEHIVDYPIAWCLKSVTGIKKNLLSDKKKQKCEDALKSAGIDINGDAKIALFYIFFETKISTKKINAIAKEYFKYMLNLILSYFDNTYAVGPEYFCENLSLFLDPIHFNVDNVLTSNAYAFRQKPFYYEECIHQISNIGNIDKLFIGSQAFEYIYLHTFTKEYFEKKNVILLQYIKDLYTTATYKYKKNMLLQPVNWCIEYLKKLGHDSINLELICEGIMKNTIFHRCDAETALRISYFKEVYPSPNEQNIEYEYYKYLIHEFKPNIDDSTALGPHMYCLEKSTSISYASYQSSTTHQLTNDPGQSYNISLPEEFKYAQVSFSDEDLDVYLKSNPSSGSTSAHGGQF